MNAAPPLDCAVCHRTIAKKRTHYLLGDRTADRLVCGRCLAAGPELHARFYPDCPDGWHDLYDHPMSLASRAAAATVLGVWP